MIITVDGPSVRMYGRIWQGDDSYIISELQKVLKNTQGDITISLHTPGGDVLSGNLIWNFLSKNKERINMIVEGLAASMGSIWITAAKSVSIAENAFIMVHAPSGWSEGNAKKFEQTAKVLRSMEDSFLNKLAARTKKDKESIKDWMVDDNWFTAQEALEAGLVDEIIDPILEESTLAMYQDVKACASLFSAFDKTSDVNTPEITQEQKPETPEQLNNNSEMKITAQALTALGLGEQPSDEQVSAKIIALTTRNTELENELKAQQKQRVDALIDAAVKAGKISASEKEQWTEDATNNYELAERALAKISGKPESLSNQTTTTDINSDADGRKDWTFNDWRKKDPVGLNKMRAESPEKYNALQR